MMHYNSARTFMAAACLALVSCSNDTEPVNQAADRSVPVAESESSDADATILEGHWTGSWGGGADGDVIFQPVIAELIIEGDHVELSGFPDAADVTGTIHVDADARRIVITESGNQVLEYAYEVNGDQLTLTAAEGREISFLKRREVQVDPDTEGVPEP